MVKTRNKMKFWRRNETGADARCGGSDTIELWWMWGSFSFELRKRSRFNLILRIRWHRYLMYECVFAFSNAKQMHRHTDSWRRKVEIIATAQFPKRGGAMKETEVRSWITWREPPERKFDCGRPQRRILRSSKTRKFMIICTLQQPFGDAEIVGRPFGWVRALSLVCVCFVYHLLLLIYYFRFSGFDILSRCTRW